MPTVIAIFPSNYNKQINSITIFLFELNGHEAGHMI